MVLRILKNNLLFLLICGVAILISGCATTGDGGGDSPIGPVRGVLLDPGHGGDPEEAAGRNGERFNGLSKWARAGYREECYGAINRAGYMEKTATLAVAKKVKSLLSDQGMPVAMTRSSDTYVSLNERVDKALSSEYRDWLMVSIHFNRSTEKQRATDLRTKYQHPNGFEIYILPGRGERSTMGSRPASGFLTANNTRSANRLLARCIESRMRDIRGIRDRGIKSAWFVVLRGSPMPSVLIEGGFMSNPEEGEKIATDEYQETLARAIVAGINDYRGKASSVARGETDLDQLLTQR